MDNPIKRAKPKECCVNLLYYCIGHAPETVWLERKLVCQKHVFINRKLLEARKDVKYYESIIFFTTIKEIILLTFLSR